MKHFKTILKVTCNLHYFLLNQYKFAFLFYSLHYISRESLKSFKLITFIFLHIDYTSKKALERSKSCDLPFAWDDPSSKEDVKFIIHALFIQVSFNSHYLDVQESVYMFMILSLLATHQPLVLVFIRKNQIMPFCLIFTLSFQTMCCS